MPLFFCLFDIFKIDMRATDAFFESFVNTEHVILGNKLKPFCLLHKLFLDQIGSPLLNGAAVNYLDLKLAVAICSSDSQEEIFKNLSPKKGIKWILERLKERRLKTSYLQKEYEKFYQYIKDYVALPDFKTSLHSEGVNNPKLPELLLRAAAVIKFTGWSKEYVFTLPLGELFWLNIAFGYLESGETDVESDAEAEAREIIYSMYGLTEEGS